ncbi:MAG: ABC transporter substrate-binding protein [Chloroflexota bacterium]|nr:ABC transporter substrate-binding protein [Chloroflexota bacterium]
MRTGGMVRVCTAIAAFSLFSAGIAPRVHAAPSRQSPVTVTVWTAYTHGLLDAFNTLSSRFQSLYPYIKINEVSSTSYSTLLPKEQSAVFAGNTPTIGQAYEAWTSQFLKSHAIQDLGPYINGKHGLSAADIRDFYPKVWKDGMLGSKHYMMPFSKSDIVLYFNRAMLRHSGISRPPTTWNEFAADCKKVTVRQGGTVSQWCTTYELDESEWYAWEYEWGNHVLDKQGKAAFATRQGAAPVSFFANLVKKKEMVVSTSGTYQGQADFDAGKTAFYMGTSAGLTYVISGAKPGVETAVAPFPAGPMHRATEMFGAPLAMFSKGSSAEKEAGWLFMKWLTEPRQTAYWAEHTGYMPVRQSAFKLMKSYYSKNPQERSSVEQLNYALVEPVVPGWTKAQTDIATNLAAALNGNSSPLQAMRSAASQVNSDLSQQ